VRYIKIGRLRVKRFGLFASAFVLAVVTAIGLLQISDPTQAINRDLSFCWLTGDH
jgi:hypothetical protein